MKKILKLFLLIIIFSLYSCETSINNIKINSTSCLDNICIWDIKNTSLKSISSYKYSSVYEYYLLSLSWSSDENKIAFDSYNNKGITKKEIYIMDSDGSNKTRLTDGHEANWSPDGNKISFISKNDIKELDIINLDGSNRTKLIDSIKIILSPDGKKFSFLSSSKGEIYVMNFDGSDKIKLSDSINLYFFKWLHLKDKLSFEIYNYEINQYEICIINSDGSNKTNFNTLNYIYNLELSPDGEKIVFFSYNHEASKYEIYIADIDGSDKRKIADNFEFIYDLVWSPDGNKIAFTSEKIANDKINEIYVVNIDGSDKRKIAEGNNVNWSSDKTKIALYNDKKISILDVMKNYEISYFLPIDLNVYYLKWSPDGNKIAIISTDNKKQD